MIQPAKKGFRTPNDFIEAATKLPDQVSIDPAAGTVTVAPPAAESPQPVADVFPPEHDKPSAEPKKTAPKPAKQAPWAAANDLVPVRYNFKMTQTQHMKMQWIVENVPRNSSLQKIIEKSVEEYVEKLLKEHYKP